LGACARGADESYEVATLDRQISCQGTMVPIFTLKKIQQI